ncbi:MAG: ATP-dependent RecD-like DNA helicase [Erysipelotrichaceae bacterium]|nr:ATP-dependent RecD-like DNA helicase [Erysipelotrichaceae bacterium]
MEIKGRFDKVIYYREDNGYTVAVFALQDSRTDEEVVVRGYIGKTEREHLYVLEGNYVEHPRYGIQFEIENFKKVIADNREDLISYLSSSQFYGIGRKYATEIVDALGVNLIERIRSDDSLLDQVPRMTARRKKAILDGLQSEQDSDNIFLMGHHLSMKNIIRIRNHYGDEMMNILTSNPYQVIQEVGGIGFATIDRFALSIGVDPQDLYRQCALAEDLLMNMCMRNGDSYLMLEDFRSRLENESAADCQEIIDQLLMNRRIAIEDDRVYHISQYDAERYVADYLAAFPAMSLESPDPAMLRESLQQVQQQLGIEYQEKQLDAVMSFFETDLLILTGGPGTGKSTIVRGMIELCRRIYPMCSLNLLAPTGRAAKRLNELTGAQAKTIHSLLLWDKETGKFAKDEDDPLTVDILIIDEFSMVDVHLFYSLLKACETLKKLILIGDADQLPSVAMGAVLRDMIESDCFECIKLEKIYRQQEGSDIIALASDIRNDCCEAIPDEHDVRFFEADRRDITALTLQVVGHALDNYNTLKDGFMNVQVLSPKHMGLNGINNLNVALQKRFNPPSQEKREIRAGYRTFRQYDKVIQLKNQPDDDVFNGDIGIIEDIIFAHEDVNNQDRLICDFDGRIVEYTRETFGNITHAYCISVHKAQGSEYPIVILPMDMDYGIMLQKRLIYTAVSRAYRSLIIIGEKAAFYKGINTTDHYVRATRLKERIQEAMYHD